MAERVSCSQLNQGQLEQIGDYYMDQMTGPAHPQMDQMMGGDGSESLKQMHILIARRWYCGDAVGYGMMGMMTGGWGSGMMGNYYRGNGQSYNTFVPAGWGMMGDLGFTYGMGLWGYLLMFLSFIFIIVGIAALVKYLTKK